MGLNGPARRFEEGADVGDGAPAGGGVLHHAALADVLAANLEASGWSVRAHAESPVTGGDGNVEYLLWAKKRPPA